MTYYRTIAYLITLWAFSTSACNSNADQQKENQEEITLSIEVEQEDLQSTAALERVNEEGKFIFVDSITFKDQKAEITLEAQEPEFFRVVFGEGMYIPLIMGKEDVQISEVNFTQNPPFKLSGSKDIENYNQISALFEQFNQKADQLQAIYSEAEERGEAAQIKDSLNTVFQALQEEHIEKLKTMLDEMMPSVTVIYGLSLLDAQQDYDYMQDFAKRLKTTMPNSVAAQRFIKYMDQLAQGNTGKQEMPSFGLEVGVQAPDFSLPTPAGKQVSLSSLKGQYVLLDFWAAWCGPCRQENPNVVAAYERFKEQNFTVLGVSLDKNREKWLKAIEKDNLQWTQVSDLQYWESSVVPLYKIEGIPMNYLIDPEGKIIAKNLRGEALQEKLAEVLK
ncbi:MAG: peroxiredoxin family protein [Thermonemataceae bacterium]